MEATRLSLSDGMLKKEGKNSQENDSHYAHNSTEDEEFLSYLNTNGNST